MPYTNQLIERVQADIAHSRARNAMIAKMGMIPANVYVPSQSSLGLGGMSSSRASGGLTTIRTPWGQSVTVARSHAPQFSQLFAGLNALGYRPKTVQGYNYRNIAGTNKLSKHALGLAVDIDPQPNRGGRLGGGGTRYGYFDPNKILPLIRRLGMSWGGTWSNPDPMHFSFGEGRS